MLKQRNRRAPLIATLGLFGMFAVPAAAQAHHIDSSRIACSSTSVNAGSSTFISFSSTGSQTWRARSTSTAPPSSRSCRSTGTATPAPGGYLQAASGRPCLPVTDHVGSGTNGTEVR